MAVLTKQINPYIIGSPIREPKFFFGRKSLFEFVKDSLNQRSRVILLHGQRRIGKSSVLAQIPYFIGEDKFAFVYFDLQDKNAMSVGVVLHRLAKEIIEHLELQPDRIEPPSVVELENNKEMFSEEFLPQVERELEDKNLVLLLDEFDVLNNYNPNSADEYFFPYLQSLIFRHKRFFIIPVVGRRVEDMPKLLSLFRKAALWEIGLLDPRSTRQLIVEPAKGILEYDDEAIAAILELTSGHPYFTQAICFALFGEARQEDRWQVSRADVEKVADKAIEMAEGGLQYFRDGLPIPERVVFSAVAEAQKIATVNGDGVVKEPLTLLKDYGVVETKVLVEAGGRLVEWGFLKLADSESSAQKFPRYKFTVELVRRWLAKRYPLRQEIWELQGVNSDANEIYELAVKFSEKPATLKNAMALYEQVLEFNPNHFQALFNLAEVSVEAQDFSKAVEVYQRVYKVDPIRGEDELVDSLLSYGQRLMERREQEQAIEQFERVLEIQPDNELALERKDRAKDILSKPNRISNEGVMVKESYKNFSSIADWLVIQEATQMAGLARNPVKDYTKNFPLIQQFSKKELQIAMGKALKKFLQLVQQELEGAGLDEEKINQYVEPCRRFIKDKSVATVLGSAFNPNSEVLDVKTLATTWNKLDLLPLPDEFDWFWLAKRYLKKVKVICREFEELRAIIDTENLETIARAVQVQPEFDLRKHQEGILERYGNLNLESLDTRAYAYNELKLWRVFIPQNVRECQEYLPRVLEIPKEHQRRLKERGDLEEQLSLEEMERYQKAYFQQSARSVLEVVKNAGFKYLVILGDPGSGKSTLLQYLTLEWARLSQKELSQQPIPLLIELRAYNRNREAGQCKDFLEFFHQGSGIICRLPRRELHQRLKMGNFLVMFDGLDEVFDRGQREEIITDIHRFTNEYSQVRVIVTSRVVGYKAQKLRDAEFRHFMLEDLEQEQIYNFIEKWHDLTYEDEEEKVRKRERLKRSISQSSAIAQLAGNPLLLTMMAILNRNQELPRDRAELYNQASKLLLYQWDVERTLQDQKITIDYRDKQEILRGVAYFMQSSEKGLAGNLIAWPDLVDVIAKYLKSIDLERPRELAGLLIERLRERNFILCYLGADYYAFVHRTFLEYFCAAEFVQRFEKQRQISPEELRTDIFGSHWRDEWWHEVLQLIAGQIDVKYVGEIIKYLLDEDGEGEKFLNVFLAAKCLAEVRNRQKIGTLNNRLLERLKDLTKYERWDVRLAAVEEIARGWQSDPDILAYLKGRAESDEDSYLRRAVVQELARGWQSDPDTLAILKGRAEFDEDNDVRGAAVQELARGWQSDPDTLAILKGRAESDEDSYVRRAVVQELARGWHDRPETLAILKSRAESDEDWNVRGTAVQELVRGWHDRSETLGILKGRAESDEDSDLRGAAVQELARGWHKDPEIFEFLRDRALNDPFERNDNLFQENPREAALKAIAQHYPHHPETLALFRDRAENDPDEQVREFARKTLERWR